MRSAAVGILVMLAALTACDRDYPPGPEVEYLVIHGLLLVGMPVQEVLVERVGLIHEGVLRAPRGVVGAQVTVTAADGTVFLFEPVPDLPGFYRASFAPEPRSVYALRVETPGGHAVTGRTETPEPPPLVRPASDSTVTGASTIPLVWQPTSGAGYVVVYGSLSGPSPTHLLADLWYRYTDVVGDTMAEAIVGWPGHYPHGAVLSVASVDSAYLRFVGPEPRRTQPRSALRSTIDGGLGLFGSAALSQERRVVVETP